MLVVIFSLFFRKITQSIRIMFSNLSILIIWFWTLFLSIVLLFCKNNSAISIKSIYENTQALTTSWFSLHSITTSKFLSQTFCNLMDPVKEWVWSLPSSCSCNNCFIFQKKENITKTQQQNHSQHKWRLFNHNREYKKWTYWTFG
jgi:hypothetical protein